MIFEIEFAFKAFLKGAAELMARGYRIDTPIGSFVPKLALKREVTDPSKVRNSDVMLDGVDARISIRRFKLIKLCRLCRHFC